MGLFGICSSLPLVTVKALNEPLFNWLPLKHFWSDIAETLFETLTLRYSSSGWLSAGSACSILTRFFRRGLSWSVFLLYLAFQLLMCSLSRKMVNLITHHWFQMFWILSSPLAFIEVLYRGLNLQFCVTQMQRFAEEVVLVNQGLRTTCNCALEVTIISHMEKKSPIHAQNSPKQGNNKNAASSTNYKHFSNSWRWGIRLKRSSVGSACFGPHWILISGLCV